MLKKLLLMIIVAATLSGCGYRGIHHGSYPGPGNNSYYYDDDEYPGGGGGGGGGGGC